MSAVKSGNKKDSYIHAHVSRLHFSITTYLNQLHFTTCSSMKLLPCTKLFVCDQSK